MQHTYRSGDLKIDCASSCDRAPADVSHSGVSKRGQCLHCRAARAGCEEGNDGKKERREKVETKKRAPFFLSVWAEGQRRRNRSSKRDVGRHACRHHQWWRHEAEKRQERDRGQSKWPH